MSNGRTIAIGDIHGCAAALRALLAALELSADDTLVMLGDAIDRGPDSRDVVEQLLAVAEQCRLVPILGNHEQMLLEAVDRQIPLHDWLMVGGAETLDSYGPEAALAEVPEAHVEFLRSWGDYHETSTHFFAHGNYLAKLPLDSQPWQEMRWRSLHFFQPGPHQSGKIAVLGHTPNKRGEVVDRGHLVRIDTWCYGGGWLTALEPATGQTWQADRYGQLRKS